MIHVLAIACMTWCLSTGKSRNVHEAFKPETDDEIDGLIHDTEASRLRKDRGAAKFDYSKTKAKRPDASRQPRDRGTETEATSLPMIICSVQH